jgi:hypothetical protein
VAGDETRQPRPALPPPPTDSCTKVARESGGSRTRTCERSSRLRASNALPYQLGHTSRRAEGEGVEPPRPAKPTRFWRRGTAPVAALPNMSGPGRRRTCNPPGNSRELRRVELRSQGVAGRTRTCAASRFRRALYRLSYGHINIGGAGIEPAPSSLSGRRSPLSYPPPGVWRGRRPEGPSRRAREGGRGFAGPSRSQRLEPGGLAPMGEAGIEPAASCL